MPTFVPYAAAFMAALFFCVIFHLFIRSRSLLKSKGPKASKKEAMDPSNCTDLIRNQIAMVQAFPHPSVEGRQNTEYLSELLLASRLYFPSSKAPLTSFSERLIQTYEDEGLFLMTLLDLRKWVNGNMQTPELS